MHRLTAALSLALLGGVPLPVRAADSVCDPSYGRVRELPHVVFGSELKGSVLLTELRSVAGWVEVQVAAEGLRLVNRHPELALPFEVARLELVWVDLFGHPLESTRITYPSLNEACGLSSIYPGQRTSYFKTPDLPIGAEARQHRLSVRVWAGGF